MEWMHYSSANWSVELDRIKTRGVLYEYWNKISVFPFGSG